MINSDKFSKRLEQIMDQHDLNASSFAEKVGVGRSSISHILSGRNKPSLDFVLSVLKNFNDVDLYWLLNGKGTYPKTEQQEKPITEKTIEAATPTQFDSTIHDDEPKSKDVSSEEPMTKTGITSNPISHKNGKNITKVIWFYDDGTFDDFIPSP